MNKSTVPIMDEHVLKAVERFLTLTPPDRLSKHVRQMLLEYMSNKFDMLPIDFHIMIDDLINFFDLMDKLHALNNSRTEKVE